MSSVRKMSSVQLPAGLVDFSKPPSGFDAGIPTPSIDVQASVANGDMVATLNGVPLAITKAGTPTTVASPYYTNGAPTAQPCVVLNGTTDYYLLGTAGNVTSNFTVAACGYTDTIAAGLAQIVGRYGDAGTGYQWILYRDTSTLMLNVYKPGGASTNYTIGTLVAGTYFAATVSYTGVADGTSVIRANFNGVAAADVNTAVYPPDTTPTAQLSIGATGAAAYPWDGNLVRTAVWTNTAASTIQLAAMVDALQRGAEFGADIPVPAVDARASTNGDLLVKGAACTKYGTPTSTESPYFTPDTQPSVVLNGSTDYYDLGVVSPFVSSFTLCWTGVFTTGASRTLVGTRSSGLVGFDVQLATTGKLRVYVPKSGGSGTYDSTTVKANTGMPSVIAVSYQYVADGSSIITANIDGVSEVITSAAVGPPIDIGGSLQVARLHDYADLFQGSMSRLTLVNGFSASASQLAAMVQSMQTRGTWGPNMPTPTVDVRADTSGGNIVATGAVVTKYGTPTTGTSLFPIGRNTEVLAPAVKLNAAGGTTDWFDLGNVGDAGSGFWVGWAGVLSHFVTGAEYDIIDKWSGANGYQWLLYAISGHIFLASYNGSTSHDLDLGAYTVNTWNVMAISEDTSGGTGSVIMRGNLNGVASTRSNGYTNASSTSLLLGGSGNGSHPQVGAFSRFTFGTSALSASQLADMVTSMQNTGDWGPSCPTPTIDARADFSGGDLIVTGATATKYGTPTTTVSPYKYPFVKPALLDPYAKSIGLNGTTDYYDLGQAGESTNDFTHCIVFTPTSVTGYHTICESLGGGYGWEVYENASALPIAFQAPGGNTTYAAHSGAGTLVIGTTYILAFSYHYVANGTSVVYSNLSGTAGTSSTVRGPVAAAAAVAKICGLTDGKMPGKLFRDSHWSGTAATAAQLASMVASYKATGTWGASIAAPTIDCKPANCHGDLAVVGATATKHGNPVTYKTPEVGASHICKPSVVFDGSTAWDSLGNVGTSTTGISILVVHKTTAAASEVILQKGNATSPWQYFKNATPKMAFGVTKADGTASYGGLDFAPVAGTWSVDAWSYRYVADGSSVILGNVNGVAATPTTNAVGPLTTSTGVVSIGANYAGASGFDHGEIVYVAIWDGVSLDATQLASVVRARMALLTSRP